MEVGKRGWDRMEVRLIKVRKEVGKKKAYEKQGKERLKKDRKEGRKEEERWRQKE